MSRRWVIFDRHTGNLIGGFKTKREAQEFAARHLTHRPNLVIEKDQ